MSPSFRSTYNAFVQFQIVYGASKISETNHTETEKPSEDGKRNWTEDIEVQSEQLLARVRELAAESQVKRIRVTEPGGDIMFDIPLTVGAIAGGAVVIVAPVLAVIRALAAFVSKVKIEIDRDVDDTPPS